MNIELDAIDLKVLCSLLEHAADELEGRGGYSFMEWTGLTQEEDAELRARMNAFLAKETGTPDPPYHPDHDWNYHYTRLERIFWGHLTPEDMRRYLFRGGRNAG